MTEASEAEFPFADLKTGERWTLRPNAGRLPWWILDSRRRVPGTRAPDYLAPISRASRAPAAKTVGDVMPCSGPLYERLWRPVLLAALNTEPAEADARLAAQILRETLAAGGHACRPMVATGGLSAAFIEPALGYLAKHGAEVRLAHSLREIIFAGERAIRLDFGDEKIEIGAEDSIVLAVPPVVARALIPGLTVPETFHAIVNAHFRIAPPKNQPLILGVINGMTEWLFAYPDRLSVTISCADRLMDEPRQRAGRDDLARGGGARPALPPAAAALADRARAPGDLCGDAGGSGAPAGAADALLQPRPRRRLDGHRASGDDRGLDPLRARGGRDPVARAWQRPAVAESRMKGNVLAFGKGAAQARDAPRSVGARRDRAAHRLRDRRAAEGAEERRPLVLRARGRRDDPLRIRALPPLPRRARGPASSKRRSPSISAASRARTAAGRSSTKATST